MALPRALSLPHDCQHCWHWVALGWTGRDDADFGQCRRSGPSAKIGDRHVEAVWPLTRNHDWCGEWAPQSDAEDNAHGLTGKA